MQYRITIKGISPLIQHNGSAALDTRSAANIEKAAITRKKGSNRTEADEERLRELDCQTSLWLNSDGAPTVPAAALRACIEQAARKLKQGPQVREGLIVASVDDFDYDKSLGATVDELGKTAQFTVAVVVQRSRVARTRAKFDDWAVTFTLEVDPELVDAEQLDSWLDIAGRRIGLGDWRPTKSGHYGRFETVSIDKVGVEYDPFGGQADDL